MTIADPDFLGIHRPLQAQATTGRIGSRVERIASFGGMSYWRSSAPSRNGLAEPRDTLAMLRKAEAASVWRICGSEKTSTPRDQKRHATPAGHLFQSKILLHLHHRRPRDQVWECGRLGTWEAQSGESGLAKGRCRLVAFSESLFKYPQHTQA